jgi:hypothetical protein
MMRITVVQSQRPVGQGGLQTTEIRAGETVYRAVYDCGALPKDQCLSQVAAYASELGDDELDLLVLSHLDEDHCNGVEELLACCGAKTVMLPYLNEVERLIEAAARAADRRLTGTALELLADPRRWFLQRGAGEVIEVEPAPDEGDIGPARTEWPYEPLGGKGPLRTYYAKESMQSRPVDAGRKILTSGHPLFCGENVYAHVWLFLPFAIRGPGLKHDAFLQQCREILKLPPGPVSDEHWSNALRTQLQCPQSRRELANAYDLVASRRNLTSMALYGGPAPRTKSLPQERVAWLGTGDWPLATTRRRQQFMRYYGAVADLVDTFCVPHHGSRHNFPPDDFWRWLDPSHAVIAAGRGREHPHKDVLARLQHLYNNLPRLSRTALVTESSRSGFERIYRVDV